MENRDREMLMRFIQQESNIKERWQIVELFEEERQRFEEERKTLFNECEKLNKEYTEKISLVEGLREQVEKLEQSFREIERKEQESKERFKDREAHSNQLHSENKELTDRLKQQRKEYKTLNLKVESLKVEYIVRQNALKVIKEKRDSLLESAALSSVHEVNPLRQVEVMGKGGKVIKAIPAKNYYAHSVMSIQSEETRSEQEFLEEIEKLQTKNIDLEIENGNMLLEIRELKNEIQALNHLMNQKKQPIAVTQKAPSEGISQPQDTVSSKDKDANINPVEQKIAALGQPVESTSFKETFNNGAFETLLTEESFSTQEIPKDHTSHHIDIDLEEEILEVHSQESIPAPMNSNVFVKETTDTVLELDSFMDTSLKPKQDDLKEEMMTENHEVKNRTFKNNPFLNENVRIITPKGFKTPREVLQD